MTSIFSDIRFALRLMRRSPGFFGLLLALIVAGVSATTAMFSIVESVLLKPLPYPNPEQLTMIWRVDPRVNPGPSSIPDFLDWKAQSTSFEKMASTNYAGLSLSSPEAKPESLPAARVTGEFFPLFGLPPLHGRLLGPEDDRPGAPPVAVVSASLFRRRFGGNAKLIGESITLDSERYTVVGVAAEGFRFSGPQSDRCDVWTPLVPTVRYAEDSRQRGNHFIHVFGRRKPGISVEAAQTELAGIAKNLEVAFPDTNAKKGVRLADLHEELVGSSRSGVWVLFAAVVLVFAGVCANVANLLLTRAQSRKAEMAARAAIGATPARLAAQMITETVTLFALGGVGGAIASFWLVDVLAKKVIDGGGAHTIDVKVDLVAFGASFAACLICGVLCGIVPSLAARSVQPHAVLQEVASRAGVGRAQRLVRGGLVVTQVAIAFALLVGSGLALKAFAAVAATPPGFDPINLASARVVLPDVKYADDASVIDFYRRLLAEIAKRPDVIAVSANDTLPMSGSNSNGSFKIEGRPPWTRGDQPNIERNAIAPGYFATMGTPVVRGREFTDADRETSRRVMVINQAAADRFFPGEDPIGKRIDLTDEDTPQWREIVGIVGNVRRRGLAKPVAPESYTPFAQHPSRWMVVVARSPRAQGLLQDLPGIVERVDAERAVSSPRLMESRLGDSISSQRYLVTLLGTFAVAALLLSTLGIFGLVSYATSQRTRELGIRMALGSTPAGLVSLVVKGGARLVALGLVLGFGCALIVGRILASRVAGVLPFDLTVYTAIPALLGLTGLVACFLPAVRVVRIPPATALRYE